jgi:hypothetical protein
MFPATELPAIVAAEAKMSRYSPLHTSISSIDTKSVPAVMFVVKFSGVPPWLVASWAVEPEELTR